MKTAGEELLVLQTLACSNVMKLRPPSFDHQTYVLTYVLNFYPPKSCFRILISYFQFLESKFSFSADISPFYVMIYNSKTLNIVLNSNLKLEF